MKSRLLVAAATTALMAIPSLATAHDESGWYLRGNAGYGVHTDIELSGGLDTSAGDATGLNSKGDVAISLGLGYNLGNSWRLELDGALLNTDLGSISGVQDTSSGFRSKSMMLNAIHNFDTNSRFEPYLGAGVGFVQGNAKFTANDYGNAASPTVNSVCDGNRATIAGGQSCSLDDTDTAFGYQLLAGLGYEITENIKWDTQYRYLDAHGMDFSCIRVANTNNTVNSLAVEASNVGAHSVMTGFRYLFGHKHEPEAPPPPPAPVPDYQCWDGSMTFNAGECPIKPIPKQTCWDGSIIPETSTCPVRPTYTCWDDSVVYDEANCPAQVFSEAKNNMSELCSINSHQEVIYYDFDEHESQDTVNAITKIADIGQYCNIGKVSVVGHTDTSGPTAYNLKLSKHRASNTKAELIARGISEDSIVSDGRGETELAVETANGVKEKMNRRTEVLVSLSALGVIN